MGTADMRSGEIGLVHERDADMDLLCKLRATRLEVAAATPASLQKVGVQFCIFFPIHTGDISRGCSDVAFLGAMPILPSPPSSTDT